MKRFRRRGSGLFTLRDEYGQGRCVMLTSAIITAVNNWLTTNIFYTSFLMIYGIDLVNIGIITFVPYIAGCFGIFAPSLLERFQKRRWILAAGRFTFATLNILGITLVPVLVHAPGPRILCFVVIIFFANLANALTNSGYSVWHLNFIPEQIRADYFVKQSTISSFIGIGASLISGVIADALSASPYADTIIIAFRYLAYALALAEIIVLLTPKEYPYSKTAEKPHLRDIFTLPFRAKPFLLTMILVCMHTYACNVSSSFLNYYLLNDIGVKYTYIYLINMAYPCVLILCQPIARRMIARWGWFRVFAIPLFIYALTLFPMSCVNASNYLWLFTSIRIFQHFTGVGINTTYANIAFVNLPPDDQTNYISFHLLVVNIATFLGVMTGTVAVAWIGERALTLFGMRFTAVQMLIWVQAVVQLIIPLYVYFNFKTLDPRERERAALAKTKQ
ncbi:MAG: MFS transporter [Clostridiaceae bacterium]|nr:MFS transporter [Clostridiaceae bacterium]